MTKIINPFNRKVNYDLDTAAHAICDCVCNVTKKNNNAGIWSSRLTFNKVCGCACNPEVNGNKDANHIKDKNR